VVRRRRRGERWKKGGNEGKWRKQTKLVSVYGWLHESTIKVRKSKDEEGEEEGGKETVCVSVCPYLLCVVWLR